MLKIGDVRILCPVVLAPLAGITDKVFRNIAREHGCGLVYTEMISAKALTYKNSKTKILLDLSGEKPPVAVQLFGSEPDVMAEAAVMAAEEGAGLLDINMGCPVPKVVKNGEGSALLEKPELACEIVEKMERSTGLPITVKIRKGLSKDRIVAVELSKRLEAAGAAAITVHGRTREQYYGGQADWNIIKRVKESVKIPVIGNGDIWEPEDAAKMLRQTGCDAVMLGRGALGNPWLISRAKYFLENGELLQSPDATEKVRGAIRHLNLTVAQKGEKSGILQMRKHIAWYLKGLPYTAPLKEAVYKAKKREEVVFLLEEYLKQESLEML